MGYEPDARDVLLLFMELPASAASAIPPRQP